MPIRILHLSDLHFIESTDPKVMLQPLIADLRDQVAGLNINLLDYLVVSGDMSNRGQRSEFERAREFVSSIIKEFGLTANRVITVPGNHDLDWDEKVYDWKPQRQVRQSELVAGEFVQQGNGVLVRDNLLYGNRFKNFSEAFYHPLLQQEYRLTVEDQYHSLLFPEHAIQFLALNSCWEIDENFPKRASINLSALSRGLEKADADVKQAINEGLLGDKEQLLRIAVWHHAITGNDKIAQDAFTGQLLKAGFQVCLHGDVHELRPDLIGYHLERQLHVIGTGAFGAKAYARPESTPKLYTYLEVAGDRKTINVHTRYQRVDGAPFDGFAIWPGEKPHEKRAFYTVNITQQTR